MRQQERHVHDIFRRCVAATLNRNPTMSLLRVTTALALTLSASLALAQGTPQQRAACRPDVVKFCKGKGEDPGVLLTCLEDNKDKISEKCRKVIEAK
jgi:hypothetical protein